MRYFYLIPFLFLSCSNSSSVSKDYESFGKYFFEALKNNNLEQFRACYITEDKIIDVYSQLEEQSTRTQKNKENLINLSKELDANIKVRYDNVISLLNNKNIDLKSTKLLSVIESHKRDDDIFKSSLIQLNIQDKGKEYILDLGHCNLSPKYGWYITRIRNLKEK